MKANADRREILSQLAEVFREYGYEGASLSVITHATGLGKGSLYNLFPGGKAEMMSSVLADIEAWFETHLYTPLSTSKNHYEAIICMLEAVARYFHAGQRICLMGMLAISKRHDPFAQAITHFFSRWIDVLAFTLRENGHPPSIAQLLAEETILNIQGAIILSRALGDTSIFQRAIDQQRERLTR
ncbi:transcriptional regulator [Neokomagataea thailandica NBRC 106555]|uniref:TetR/AcrR family transcriptional regulator n=3 Tax=Acetobacteraceae TaxID=433 RepID=A0A4Y6VB64_9PROT|nr:TetR/AcrR family transcriptional regulator [Neokomagataea tanensis]GBR54022.1 transcriptional regulator [Neokomagataea thailandica NBRC 106555]